MNKLFGIILLILFLFAQLFSYHFWKQAQLGAKAKASVAKFSSDLVTLTFHQKEIKKLDWENKEEFSFNGLMYDVVKMTTQNDSTVFVCYADKNETWIVREIEELANKLFGTGSETQEEDEQPSIKDIPLYCQILPEFINEKYRFSKNTLFAQYIFLYKHAKLDSKDLPPKFLV